ncbi:ERF family protein [Candidatus Pacearchaeota archaeon]|nr:ERF family protein [Candidatus Pacearchaeota archaeon]
MTDELAVREPDESAKLLTLAIEKGATVEALEKLMALQERHNANEARKAYHVAMTAFKKKPPMIVKTKDVKFGETSYRHADLAEVATTIGKALNKQGLSAAWRTDQEAAEKGGVTVACEITHVLGHTERTSLTAPPDTSGKKNSIQAIASTVTYLQRYTLLALTGLAAQNTDDDGKGAEDTEFITDEQAVTLSQLITDTGTDVEKFLKFFNIEDLQTLPADKYKQAVAQLEVKKQRGPTSAK